MKNEGAKKGGDKKEEVKKETQPTLSRKESQPKLTRNDSQSKPTAKSKRRIITSDDEDDEENGSRESSTKPTSKLSAKTSLEPTSSMVRDADQAAMEAMMSMDVDEEEVETEEKPKVRAESKDKKRKRKQVKKSRVEMDERGYMGELVIYLQLTLKLRRTTTLKSRALVPRPRQSPCLPNPRPSQSLSHLLLLLPRSRHAQTRAHPTPSPSRNQLPNHRPRVPRARVRWPASSRKSRLPALSVSRAYGPCSVRHA